LGFNQEQVKLELGILKAPKLKQEAGDAFLTRTLLFQDSQDQ
jgi:hypothetical protein